MSTPTSLVASFFDAADFTGSRHARPVIDALAARETPPRVLISGNAGSGKTTILRGAQRYLARNRVPLLMLGPDTDVMSVPSTSILLVDDLHLLPAAQIEGLRLRASDPEAALVATARPWPNSPELSSIARHLERSRPAVVLGHVTRSDVLEYLHGSDEEISPACVEHILTITGGVAWLVSAALAAHDDRDCAGDGDHLALRHVLQQSVAHRIDVVDDEVRRAIEATSVASSEDASVATDVLADPDGALAQGYAEGLLLRNGRPVPLVRDAVRATMPARRLADLLATLPGGIDPAESGTEWLNDVRDTRLAGALMDRADPLLDADPVRARELYHAAAQTGVASADLSAKRAQAAWACGDIDAAAHLVDEAMASPERDAVVDERLADVAAAVWSMRGMLHTGSSFYEAMPPRSPESMARAFVARIGAGLPAVDDTGATPAGRPPAPTTLTVAMRLLQRGLEGTLESKNTDAALADLVRASHLYTSSRSAVPLPEHPAVIAAVAAISKGDLSTARAVVDAAIDGHTGTPWTQSRLLLWRSWVALLQARAARSREALDAALALTPKPTPRDDMLVQAIRIGLARRYEDKAALAAVWERGRDALLDTDVDLFTLLPLSEFVAAGARVGDEATTRTLFARALRLVEGLGSPVLWTAHLQWTGIQRGILLDEPESLSPYAHALVDASAVSSVAATMAKVGRLWTSVLAGTAEADEVEAAAQSLAAIGLKWDAARLASHGARRTDDRKVSSRLLACARELHPLETSRPAESGGDEGNPSRASAGASVLSERETDVARLVVQGKTYAEIGETIFISPRTAEHHIASIRRRLGATSRSDLIAKLRVALDDSATHIEAAS